MDGKKLVWLVLAMVVLGGGMVFGATSTKVTNKTSSSSSKNSEKMTSSSSSQKALVEQKSLSKKRDTHYKPTTFALNVGIDLWAFTYGGFAISPGLEWSIGQYVIEDTIPLDFGVTVQGFYYTYGYDYWSYSWRYNYLGAGLYGTVHFGPKKTIADLPKFLEKLDFYAGVGLFFRQYWITFSDPEIERWYRDYYRENVAAIGFATIGGVTYFLTDNIGIRLDSAYYGYFGTTLSLVVKF